MQAVIATALCASVMTFCIPGEAHAANDAVLRQLEQRRQSQAGRDLDTSSGTCSKRIVVRRL